MKLHAIDVFAGCGGLTVGLKRAGIAVRAAIELEKHAAASYRANHSDVHVFEQDIRNLSGDAILRKIGIDRLDMIAGTAFRARYSRIATHGITTRLLPRRSYPSLPASRS